MVEELKKAFPEASDACFQPGTVVRERGGKFEVRCASKEAAFCKIRIDGCLTTDKTLKKCDFAVVKLPSAYFCFVEFKGQHETAKAVQQLQASAALFDCHWPLTSANARAFVIGKGMPRNNVRTQRMKKQFARTTGFEVVFQSGSYTHHIA